MSLWGDLYRGQTRFDFVGQRRRWWTASAVMVGASLIALIFFGLNLSVDFEGGLVITVPNPAGATVEAVRDAIDPLGQADARIQLVDGGEQVRVQTGFVEDNSNLVDAVSGATGAASGEASVEAVGPTFGAQIAQRALLALVVFIGAVILYITWRMDFKMAVIAIVALVHDLIITAGIYAITRLEVTPATVVAILTILGYSLYDTVVVFDKVKENEHEMQDVATYTDIVNTSMNQVLMRSINTSLVSLIPVGCLLVIGSVLLGASTLNEFALALFIGIGVGTYSSIGLAGPLLAVWKEGEEAWVKRRRKIEEKDQVVVRRAETPTPAVSAIGPASPAPSTSRPPAASGATPRPPRKRKR